MEASRVVVFLTVITHILVTAIVLIMSTIRAPVPVLTIRAPMRTLTRMVTLASRLRATPPACTGVVVTDRFIGVRVTVDDVIPGVQIRLERHRVGHGRLRRSRASRTSRAVASNSRRRVSARFQATSRRHTRVIIDGRACLPLLKLMVHFRPRGQRTPVVSR